MWLELRSPYFSTPKTKFWPFEQFQSNDKHEVQTWLKSLIFFLVLSIFFFFYHISEGPGPEINRWGNPSQELTCRPSPHCSQGPPSSQKMNCPSPAFPAFFSSVAQQSDVGRGEDRIICFGLSHHRTAWYVHKRGFLARSGYFLAPSNRVIPSEGVYVTCQKKKLKPWLGNCRHVW